MEVRRNEFHTYSRDAGTMVKTDAPMTDEPPVSKTRKKQEMQDMQAHGARLVQLPEERLRQLDLPENLLSAVLEAKRITAHGGLRRQLRYIAKLMRAVDVDALLQAFAGADKSGAQHKQVFHAAERWRERLLEEDGAIDELVQNFPTADAPALRVLVRSIKNEPADRPSKHRRSLFRILHALLESATQNEVAQD